MGNCFGLHSSLWLLDHWTIFRLILWQCCYSGLFRSINTLFGLLALFEGNLYSCSCFAVFLPFYLLLDHFCYLGYFWVVLQYLGDFVLFVYLGLFLVICTTWAMFRPSLKDHAIEHWCIQTRSVNNKDKLMLVAEFRFIQLRKEIQHHNVLTQNAV